MFKKTIYGALLFIVIFIGATLSFNYIQNRKREGRAVEGYNPTMEKAFIIYDGKQINSMLGYVTPIDTSLYRDSVVPIDDSKEVKILLPDSLDSGAELKYELRSFDGANLIEEGDFRFSESKNDMNSYVATLRMSINTGTEYSFVTKIEKGNKTLSYYTRVVKYNSTWLPDFLTYAKDFSDNIYKGNADANYLASATDAVTYNVSGTVADMNNGNGEAESDAPVATTTDAMAGIKVADITNVFGSADASSIMYKASLASSIKSDGNPGYVTLESSYEDVIYSGMRMERLSEPIPKVREVSEDSAIIEMKYKAISELNGNATTYSVSEYISLEYDNGAAAIKVNDYRRYVNQDFGPSGIDYLSSSVRLGIASDHNPKFIIDDETRKMAFVADNSLWLYNNSNDTFSSVYGTSFDEAEHERVPQEGYEISLLAVDSETLDFVVYGRLNEGPREGQSGVALYEYSIPDATLREISFIEVNQSLDAMKLSIGRFSYYDKKERNFYVLIGENLLKVDIFSGNREPVITDMPSSQILVSENQRVIAYPDTSSPAEVKKINIIDFEKGKKAEKVLADHNLALLGFVGSDIMYGAATADNIITDIDGTPSFFFDKLYIVKANGDMVKKYDKEGFLVSNIRFEDSAIYLTRIKKDEETGEHVRAKGDYISFKPSTSTSDIKTIVSKNEEGNEEVYLKFPDSRFVSYNNEELFTKVVSGAKAVEMKVDDAAVDKVAAYIYEPKGIDGLSYSVGQAIQSVSENGGFVVDAYGKVVYRPKQVRPYLTVAGTFDYKSVDNEADSLVACNYMCLLAAGLPATYDDVRTKNDWLQSFAEYGDAAQGINLSGVSLDTAIGYLSDGSPFAARIGNRYVLVVSYNADFVRYYDPVDNEEVKKQRYAFQLKCEDKGNEFYTFVR